MDRGSPRLRDLGSAPCICDLALPLRLFPSTLGFPSSSVGFFKFDLSISGFPNSISGFRNSISKFGFRRLSPADWDWAVASEDEKPVEEQEEQEKQEELEELEEQDYRAGLAAMRGLSELSESPRSIEDGRGTESEADEVPRDSGVKLASGTFSRRIAGALGDWKAELYFISGQQNLAGSDVGAAASASWISSSR